MRFAAVLGTALLALPLLPGAATAGQAALPGTGIAIETSRGVQLVDSTGRLLRSLPGYRFRSLGFERPGQVELRGPSGQTYELRGGVLAPIPGDTVRLDRRYALRVHGDWLLLYGGAVVERFASRTHVELDASGTVLTAIRGHSRPVARDLATGDRRLLRSTCRIAARSAAVHFELCGYPFDPRRPSTIVRVDRTGRHALSGPAEHAPHGPAGWWETVAPSPDGRQLLAQWSGQCELPTAYLVDAHSGALTQIGGGVESVALGWMGRSPLVALPEGACGSTARRPGVYVFGYGAPARLVYALPSGRPVQARLWH